MLQITSTSHLSLKTLETNGHIRVDWVNCVRRRKTCSALSSSSSFVLAARSSSYRDMTKIRFSASADILGMLLYRGKTGAEQVG